MLANMEVVNIVAPTMNAQDCWRTLSVAGAESLISQLCVSGQWQLAVAVTALHQEKITAERVQTMLRHIPRDLSLEVKLAAVSSLLLECS